MTDLRLRRTLGCVLAALMLVPPAVAIVTMWGRPWYPVSDLAIFDMSVRDVWSAHPPLTGLWSRPGWSHPGPLAYWLVSGFAGPLGFPAWATRVGAALLDGVAIAAMAWITWRRGLRLMMVAAAVAGLTYLATGPWIFRQPWNLHIPLPYFLLFLFLTVVIAEGATRLFIALAFVGSLIVQTHVGYAMLVATGTAWAIAWTVADARRHRRAPDRWRSTLLLSLAVLVVVWLPAVVETLVYWPGNTYRLGAYFLGSDYAHVGLSRAAGTFASEFRIVPPMLGGPDRQVPYVGFATPSSLVWLVVPLVFLLAGFLATRASRRRDDRRRVALATVLTVVAVLAISRADEPRAYTFQWRVVVAAFVVTVCVAAVVSALDGRRSTIVRMVGVAAVVGITACGAIAPNISPTSVTRGPPERREAALRSMTRAFRRQDLDGRTILLRQLPSSDQLFGGIVDELDRRGIDVRIPADQDRLYGGHRVGSDAGADEVWYVTERGSDLPALLALPGARVVASMSPLSPAEDRELARLQSDVGAELMRAGQSSKRQFLDSVLFALAVADVRGIDATQAARIVALNQRVTRNGGCRCAIVAIPGGRDRARG